MSPKPDYCAICYEAWLGIPDVEERKSRSREVSHGITWIAGTRVCGSPDCHNIAREKAGIRT